MDVSAIPEPRTVVPLILRLLDLCEDGGDILGKDRLEVREIGVALNAAGGFALMQRVCEAVYETIAPRLEDGDGALPSWFKTGFHPAEVSCAWDGVGEWKW